MSDRASRMNPQIFHVLVASLFLPLGDKLCQPQKTVPLQSVGHASFQRCAAAPQNHGIKSRFTISSFLTRAGMLLVLGAVLSLGVHGSEQHEKAKTTPNIILITVDTLRADHLGCYGYRIGSTPVIDGLAKEGIQFTNATTHVPLTLPSHYSILTGTFPFYHGVRDNSRGAVGGPPLISELLRQKGHRTGAFIGSYILDSRFGLNRGFDTYYDDFDVSLAAAADVSSIRRPAEPVVNEAIAWIETSQKPFFAWIHLYDPHSPYSPPPRFASRFRTSLYNAQIAYVDWCLGRLVDFLRKRGIFDQTAILFTSDHGEGLGDHREPGHGLFVYESTIHVPLIVRLPGGSPHGERVSRLVQSVDIAPTILQLAGLASLPEMQGVSLREIFAPPASVPNADAEGVDQWSYFETLYPQREFGWSAFLGIKTARYKYIDAPRPELYDLRTDAGETTNLFSSHATLAAQMKQLLYSKLAKYRRTTPVKSGGVSAPDVVHQLSSLGYLSGSAPMAHSAHSAGKDPKDGIDLYLRISEALDLSNQGRSRSAAEVLEKVLRMEPEMTSARIILASQYEKVGEYGRALAQYARAAAQEPKNPLLYFNLGNVFSKQGNLDEAISQYRQVLKLDPTFVASHTALGITYRKQKRWPEALEQFTHALESGPNYVARYNLATIYMIQGQLNQALGQALKALALQPAHFEAYNLLGSIYLLNNRNSEAEEAFRHAVRLNAHSDEALTNLAQALTRTQKLEEAQLMLREALRINPGREAASKLLAKLVAHTDTK